MAKLVAFYSRYYAHEDEAKYDFDKNNEMLCSDATNANK